MEVLLICWRTDLGCTCFVAFFGACLLDFAFWLVPFPVCTCFVARFWRLPGQKGKSSEPKGSGKQSGKVSELKHGHVSNANVVIKQTIVRRRAKPKEWAEPIKGEIKINQKEAKRGGNQKQKDAKRIFPKEGFQRKVSKGKGKRATAATELSAVPQRSPVWTCFAIFWETLKQRLKLNCIPHFLTWVVSLFSMMFLPVTFWNWGPNFCDPFFGMHIWDSGASRTVIADSASG